MSDERTSELRKCPACKQPLSDTFQTKCPTSGHELSTAESAQAVKDFFKKLDDLSQKEYEADKAREGAAKIKSKQPKFVVFCEVAAIVSAILIILHVTGINKTIVDFTNSILGTDTVLEENSVSETDSDLETDSVSE